MHLRTCTTLQHIPAYSPFIWCQPAARLWAQRAHRPLPHQLRRVNRRPSIAVDAQQQRGGGVGNCIPPAFDFRKMSWPGEPRAVVHIDERPCPPVVVENCDWGCVRLLRLRSPAGLLGSVQKCTSQNIYVQKCFQVCILAHSPHFSTNEAPLVVLDSSLDIDAALFLLLWCEALPFCCLPQLILDGYWALASIRHQDHQQLPPLPTTAIAPTKTRPGVWCFCSFVF